jgi:hypothetical protein
MELRHYVFALLVQLQQLLGPEWMLQQELALKGEPKLVLDLALQHRHQRGFDLIVECKGVQRPLTLPGNLSQIRQQMQRYCQLRNQGRVYCLLTNASSYVLFGFRRGRGRCSSKP